MQCATQAHGWIAASTPEDAPWREVMAHVRSELSLRKIGLCTSTATTDGVPLARLIFQGSADQQVKISLVTGSELVAERTLDLQSLPSDARLLAIAVASDELLAASLGELERRRARASRPAATAPRPAPPLPARVAPEPRFELGPGFVYDRYGGGQSQLGADLRVSARSVGPLALMLRLGYRQALPESAPHGSLRASGVLGGIGVRLPLLHEGRLRLFALGRVDALRLTVSAYPNVGATTREQSDVAVVAAAGPGMALTLSEHLRIGLDVTAGGALRPVHVTDSGQRVTGVSGLALAVGGGVNVAF
jgi:hypothetical protein